MASIADQMRGLPMEELIGGPLSACCIAQYDLADTMITFIRKVGFVDPEATPLKTATIDFEMTRPIDDGTATTPMATQLITVNAPLLGLVPIPALLIETVDINFTMEVKSSTSAKTTRNKEASLSAKAGWGWGSVEVKGSVSSQKENTRSTDNSAKYVVSVIAKQQPPAEGMSKLMDLMATACDPIQITKGP